MARKIIWLLAVLLISAAGLPKPAAAVTYEFIQTSDPATSEGYVAQGTLVIDEKGSVQEFDFGIAGFGVSLDSFIDLEPPQFGDLSIDPPDVAFDYYDGSSNYLAFDGMYGAGGIFLTDGPSTCFDSGCFFDGYWQMVGAALVPEPASFGLLASGVMALAVVRRRKPARRRERHSAAMCRSAKTMSGTATTATRAAEVGRFGGHAMLAQCRGGGTCTRHALWKAASAIERGSAVRHSRSPLRLFDDQLSGNLHGDDTNFLLAPDIACPAM